MLFGLLVAIVAGYWLSPVPGRRVRHRRDVAKLRAITASGKHNTDVEHISADKILANFTGDDWACDAGGSHLQAEWFRIKDIGSSYCDACTAELSDDVQRTCKDIFPWFHRVPLQSAASRRRSTFCAHPTYTCQNGVRGIEPFDDMDQYGRETTCSCFQKYFRDCGTYECVVTKMCACPYICNDVKLSLGCPAETMTEYSSGYGDGYSGYDNVYGSGSGGDDATSYGSGSASGSGDSSTHLYDPENCPHGSSTSCWADSAFQECPVDRQGAYDRVIAQSPDLEAMYVVYHQLIVDKVGCTQAAAARGDDSCWFAHDGECDEPSWCSVGTDYTDCSQANHHHLTYRSLLERRGDKQSRSDTSVGLHDEAVSAKRTC